MRLCYLSNWRDDLARAHMQSHKSYHFSYSQIIEVEEGSDQNIDLKPRLTRQHVRLKDYKNPS